MSDLVGVPVVSSSSSAKEEHLEAAHLPEMRQEEEELRHGPLVIDERAETLREKPSEFVHPMDVFRNEGRFKDLRKSQDIIVRPRDGNPGPSGAKPKVGKREKRKEDDDVTSSIPDLEFDGTTVLCRVCGDKASGFHYGVHSCEGCKGFFRRSIQQKIQYRLCTKNQQCTIQRVNRNRCQYCRLKKCIAVGMSRDAVRFGRVPKREKARIFAAMQCVNARSQEKAVMSELEDDASITSQIVKAHMETCDFTSDKVEKMYKEARARPVFAECPPNMTCPLNPAPLCGGSNHGQQGTSDFNEPFYPAIRGVVEFARRLPGFQKLVQEDQITLLKAGAFEVLLVRLAPMFDSQNNAMLCLNGQLLRCDSLNTSPNGHFLLDTMFKFVDRVNNMSLTDFELALFCSVVIVAPDRPGLRNSDLVERVQRRYLNCLQTVVAKHHPDCPGMHHDLLAKIPDLRTLNTLHSEKLLAFKKSEYANSGFVGHWEDERVTPWDDKEMSTSPYTPCLNDKSRYSPLSESVYSSQESPLYTDSEAAYSSELGYGDTDSCVNAVMYSNSTASYPVNSRHRKPSGGASSGDEGSELPEKCSYQQMKSERPVDLEIESAVDRSDKLLPSSEPFAICPFGKRKSESPDSGIDSGTDRSDKLSSPSVCSSPRSSIDEKSEEDREDDMPVLRRALQAPPLMNTDLLMEATHKPHKKFRALRREEEPHSSSSPHTPVSSSILAETLSQPVLHSTSIMRPASAAPNLARSLLENCKSTEETMKRADAIHFMIMRGQTDNNHSRNHNSRFISQSRGERNQVSCLWNGAAKGEECGSILSSQPRAHLLTAPSPSRYYEPRTSISTPVGLGAQPCGVPSSTSNPIEGLGAQPRSESPSVVELQVDIADSQPLNLSKKTPPPMPQEFALEVL